MINRIVIMILLGLLASCGGSGSTDKPEPEVLDNLSFSKGELCFENAGECYAIPGKTYLYSTKWNDGYYVLLYDGSRNVAGSSGQASYYDGIELYSLKNRQLTYISNFFLESSIDSFFRSIIVGENLVICASKECSLFRRDGTTIRFSAFEVGPTLLITGLQSEEGSDGYRVLLKEAHPIEKAGELDTSEYMAFSALLDEDFVISSVDEISNADLLSQVLLEVSSFKQEFFLRQDNKEGRIAWGQHYIIDWYIMSHKYESLSSHRRSLLDSNMEFYAGENVKDLLLSRRYSMYRQDGLFLLHLSRFSQILNNYIDTKSTGFDHQITLEVNEVVGNYLDGNDKDVIEVLSPYFFTALNETRPYLKFSDNSVFWADGAIVPLNYVSDYITALIGQGDQNNLDLAESLLTTHLDLIGFPISPSWLYWYGDGLNGWQDISSNTPTYQGDTSGSAADISYRTADAMAFLTWCSKFPDYKTNFNCGLVKEQLYLLILSGNLEPHLLRFFDDRDVTLALHVSSRFIKLSFLNDLRNLLFLK